METHIPGRAHIRSNTWGMAGSGHGCCQTRKMAICWHSRFSVQQLCQHLASSPVLSYRSNTMSLQWFTFPKSSLPPEGGKTYSLIRNASFFLNITKVYLEWLGRLWRLFFVAFDLKWNLRMCTDCFVKWHGDNSDIKFKSVKSKADES